MACGLNSSALALPSGGIARRVPKPGYKKQWLARALLLCAMHRAGVRALRGAGDVRVASFAQAFPDSKAWFSRLKAKGQNSTLRAFFKSLNYVGRPEFFSMFACLLGNRDLHMPPAWFRKHRRALRAEMALTMSKNGFMGVPGLCVRSVRGCAGVQA